MEEQPQHRIILQTDPKIPTMQFYENYGFSVESMLSNYYTHQDAIANEQTLVLTT